MTLFKSICFLVALTLVVFGNLLGNGFIGDDHALIEGNSFYQSGKIERIFSRDYLSVGNMMQMSQLQDRGSGSVAFRPVTSLTYFIDRFFWGETPFGYHATSIFIHVINVLLVFALLKALCLPGSVVFIGACLFSIHPLQSEPVAAIAYRSDLLVALFILSATIFWIRFRNGKGVFWLGLAALAFVLALFSKETAVVWPLWCLFYDRSRALAWSSSFIPIGLLGCLVTGYLWLYFFVFQNTTLGGGFFVPFSMPWLGGMVEGWGTYILFLLAPWIVVPLPGNYMPLGVLGWGNPWLWLVIVFLGVVIIWWRAAFVEEKLLLLWAFLFFIPVSGIIFNPNPVACRYLYLPLAGLAGAASLFFVRCLPDCLRCFQRPLILGYLTASLLFVYIDNGYWKNDYQMGMIWVDKFPDFYKGHLVLGIELIHQGKIQESIVHLQLAAKDVRCMDPLVWHGLTYAYASTGRSSEAQCALAELERLYPWYMREAVQF